VVRRPATRFEDLACELRSAVGIWQRSHTQQPNLQETYFADNDVSDQYYVDRRYNGGYNGGGRGRSDSRRGDFRGRYRGGYSGRSSSYSNRKKCFVCGKPDCWSTRHSHEKRLDRRRKWRAFTQSDGTNDDFKAFLQNYEDDPNECNDFDAFVTFVQTDKNDNENTEYVWHSEELVQVETM
jgi:hypothetical protein